VIKPYLPVQVLVGVGVGEVVDEVLDVLFDVLFDVLELEDGTDEVAGTLDDEGTRQQE
jgi:hypothetical protein